MTYLLYTHTLKHTFQGPWWHFSGEKVISSAGNHPLGHNLKGFPQLTASLCSHKDTAPPPPAIMFSLCAPT